MKPIQVGDITTCDTMPLTRNRILPGDRFDHLVIVERVERDGRLKGYRCRCIVERDGAECGNLTVKISGNLRRDGRFRACPGCVDEHVRKTRRSLTLRHYAGNRPRR